MCFMFICKDSLKDLLILSYPIEFRMTRVLGTLAYIGLDVWLLSTNRMSIVLGYDPLYDGSHTIHPRAISSIQHDFWQVLNNGARYQDQL